VGSLIPSNNYPLFSLIIRKGFSEANIKRKTSNVVAALSELGGFISMLRLIFTMIVYKYSESMYFNAILNQLFKQQQDLVFKKNKIKNKAQSENL